MSNSTKRKVHPLRSWVWEFFKSDKDDKNSKCDKCGQLVPRTSRNTKGMIEHLRIKHSLTSEGFKRNKLEQNNLERDAEYESSDDEDEEDLNDSQMDNGQVQGVSGIIFVKNYALGCKNSYML